MPRRRPRYDEDLDPLAISTRIRSRYLIPGERVVVSTRRHWWRLAGPVALSAVLLVAMVAGVLSPAWGEAAQVLVWAWFASLGYLLWRWLEWRTEWFIATDRRLLKTYGLITRRVAMMPLAKVTDMSYDRSLLGRMLGYGEFVMESAGQDQALSKMDLMPDPERKYRAMCETIFDGSVSDPTEDGEHWGTDGRAADDRYGSREDRAWEVEEHDRRWVPIERHDLPTDWDWVEDEARHARSATRRRVAVDPDPTPWQ